MTNQLAIENVITISVEAAGPGLNEYNTSNLAIFTNDIPGNSFPGSFQEYLEPTSVGIDFGTDSKTYKMALAIFSQQPNILANDGQLIVIPMLQDQQSLTFSATPAAGHFVISTAYGDTANIQWNATAGDVQNALRAIAPATAAWVSTGSPTSGPILITAGGTYGPVTAYTIPGMSNTLVDGGSSPVGVTVASVQVGEDLDSAITRTKDLVQYFGILIDQVATTVGSTDITDAAALVQTLNKIFFFVTYDQTDLTPTTGLIDALRLAGYTQTRALFYKDFSTDRLKAIGFSAAYAGRGLSTVFDGSNTTQTMHLKTLVGVDPDPNIDQTVLDMAVAVGADTYPSIQGTPCVFTSGENSFFDEVYNLRWFVGALAVAGFNYLKQAATKIPQTENGMEGLKGAYRQVCQLAVTNAYSAPGTWNSPTTFGNQADFLANIQQFGFYVFSLPVGQQSQTDRAARQAPLVQIALKEAGAIQKSNVLVFINP